MNLSSPNAFNMNKFKVLLHACCKDLKSIDLKVNRDSHLYSGRYGIAPLLELRFFFSAFLYVLAFDLLLGTDLRDHQTSPTVVNFKGRLTYKFQHKSILSCEIGQIHSLFRHGFIKTPKSKFNRNRKKMYFVLM